MNSNTTVIEIPEDYRYVIERDHYEFKRKTEAVSFLLTQEFDNEDSDICESEKVLGLIDAASKSLINVWDSVSAIGAILTSDDMVSGAVNIRLDRDIEKICITKQ